METNSKILFWNVDTQVDFIEPQGKLYAPGAEKIKPILKKITDFAKAEGISVVNTCDYHFPNSPELSDNPDFVTSFPEHCMAGTAGAEYIAETNPADPFVVDWRDSTVNLEVLESGRIRNIVIRKDAFDVFSGNPHTVNILKMLQPEKVFVYGVTTNVCVDQAVMGLSKRGLKVFVIEDAIKELPNIPLPFEKWKESGVTLIAFSDITAYL